MTLGRNFAVLLAALAMAGALLLAFAREGEGRVGGVEVDPRLEGVLSGGSGGEPVRAVLTFEARPTAAQVAAVRALGVEVETFEVLPMLAVEGTAAEISGSLELPGLVSVYEDRQLEYLLEDSTALVGSDRANSELGFTGEGVGVAVIDSGVDGTNPDVSFGDELVQNAKIVGDNFFTGQTVTVEDLPNTDTTSGHGTHVAGTVGGSGEASGGLYAGVAPEADLVGVGTGDALFILYALEGFDYALANQDEYNVEVISNSWGTTGPFDPEDPVNVASRIAHDRGMTVVFASGNEGPGNDTLNPYSVAPWVIGVAAGNKDGKTLADFSSRGRPGDDLYRPTLTAPGVDIVSARASTGSTINALAAADDATTIPPQYLPYYTTSSGTSMATPHVSGTIALMEEADPTLTPDEAKQILQDTATPMPGYEPHEVGAGYLNAYDAVARAAGS